MKARKLGSSLASAHPGNEANEVSMYCARSGAGFGGGGGRKDVHPAMSRIASKANRAMWVVYLEMLVALAIAVLIIWLTRPPKKRDGDK